MSRDQQPNRTSQRAYRQLVETATEPLFVVDTDGRFEIANEEFLALVGYEREELVGMPARRLLADDAGSDWDQQINLLRTTTASESDTWSTHIVTKQGTEAPVELKLTAVESTDGETVGFAGLATDEREQRRREQRLNILNRALRHNIRNRMNIILGHANTLQDIDDEGYRTLATQIADVGTEIINISDKARKAHKHLDIPDDADCRTDLVDVTDAVVATFEISHPGTTVGTNLPDSALARAPPAVEVALAELLENAVVHNPSGSGPVTVRIEHGEPMIHAHVEDECPPVPDAVVGCLEQGEEQPLDHNEGLGLWIVQWVVETVGGDLSFERRPDDEGNVVTLSFDALPG